jgi:hypothetical protein
VRESEETRKRYLMRDFLYSINHIPVASTVSPMEPFPYRSMSVGSSPGTKPVSFPASGDPLSWNIPFQTPILSSDDIKSLVSRKSSTLKKSLKYVTFLDVTETSASPSSILSVLGSQTPSAKQFPVFLATYADLVEMNESILWILSYRPDCPILFIPNGSTDVVIQYLHKLQEEIEKVHTPSEGTRWKRNSRPPSSLPQIPESLRTPYAYLMTAILVLRTQHSIPLVLFNAPSH